MRTPGLSPAPGLPARGRQGTNYYKIIVTDDGRVWGRVGAHWPNLEVRRVGGGLVVMGIGLLGMVRIGVVGYL